MKITRQPWAAPAAFKEPVHPGPDGTIGQHLEYTQAMSAIQHLRPGFLKKGTRVLTRLGEKATVTNFVPYDGYNIGIRVDKAPAEGVITARNSIKELP